MKKARLTTVLSLTGVLVAGSAAALVNTEVLGNPTPRTAIASEITAGLPEGTGLPDDTVVSVSVTTSPSAPPDSEVTVDSTDGAGDDDTRSTYKIGSIALVTLDAGDDVLRLVSTEANPGWTVTGTTQVDPLNVQVTIQSLQTTVVFRANLLYDEVSTSLESWSNVASGGPSTSDTTSNTVSSNTVSSNTTPSNTVSSVTTTNDVTTTTGSTSSTTGGQVGGGGGDPTPVTTGITTHTTSPSTTPTTVDDHGGGGGGGKGGDDHSDD